MEPGDAEIVRLIYEKYLEPEMRLTTVVRWLNDHGYRRISRGISCPFNRDFAARVLDNPFYCGKIVYFRRANRGKEEKDQREEITVRGKHEAIIPEEMWERAQAKRRQGAVRYEKDEPDRISMLSGLVKCPMCGAGLVMKKSKRVNRNRGGHYKSIHYYACRYYRKSEGRRCGFHHTYNQKNLDGAVMEILGQLTRTEEFQKLHEKVDVSSLEEERELVKGELVQVMGAKKKLVLMLDKLDVNDRHYERKYQDMQERLDNLYDRISELEETLSDVETKISASCGEQITGQQVYQFLLEFDKIYRKMTDLEKKEFMRTFIKAIELYPERDDSGRIIKQISFKFPVYYNGCEGDTIRLLNENTVETVVKLCRKIKAFEEM